MSRNAFAFLAAAVLALPAADLSAQSGVDAFAAVLGSVTGGRGGERDFTARKKTG